MKVARSKSPRQPASTWPPDGDFASARWWRICKHKPLTGTHRILVRLGGSFRKARVSGSDRANRSPSAMCHEQDALLDNLYPLTLDKSAMHSLVGCRGEQCQRQIFCREPWIY